MDLLKLFGISKDGWVSGGKETRCGSGSTLQATKPIRKAFPGILERFKIENILDIGCGDLNWIHDIIPDEVEYTGIDWVIPIQALKRQRKNMKFIERSIFDMEIGSHDMIICKDVMIHMNLVETTALFWEMINSSTKYLLLTTFDTVSQRENRNAPYWEINMDKEPFFDHPIVVHSIHLENNKYIKLYKL